MTDSGKSILQQGIKGVALLIVLLLPGCTRIQLDDWILTENQSDLVRISYPYWSAIIRDKEDGSTSDGYFEIKSGSDQNASKVWKVSGFKFGESAVNDRMWIRFRSLNEDALLVQSTRFVEGKRTIEIFPIRRIGKREYRMYAYDPNTLQEWLKKQPLIQSLEAHIVFGTFSIRFDSFACRQYPSEIIQLMSSLDQAAIYKEDTFLEMRGFNDLESLKTYTQNSTDSSK